MPRKSSSAGRPSPRPVVASLPTPSANHSTSAPVRINPASPPAPLQQSGGGSMLGNIGGAIADGMAFGTGSAIAHRVVDSVMGPRVVQHEHTAVNNAGSAVVSTANSVPTSIPDSCTSQAKAFQDCITSNGSDISKCQFYLDMLSECKKGPTVGF